jgi:hypothetical protein
MEVIGQNQRHGEYVIYRATLDWAVFINSAVFISVWIAIFIITFVAYTLSGVYVYFGLSIFSIICTILGSIQFVRAITVYFTTEIALTNTRITTKAGLIYPRSLELPLTTIGGIAIKQSFWGRLLNYGTILVHFEKFENVSRPREFLSQVVNQVPAEKQVKTEPDGIEVEFYW